MRKVFYLHTPPSNGRKVNKRHRATIACTVDGEVIKFGYAICSGADNFSRSEGRKKAEERMDKGFGQVKFKNDWFEHFPTPEAALLEFATTLAKGMRRNFEKYKRRLAAYRGVALTPKQPKEAPVVSS